MTTPRGPELDDAMRVPDPEPSSTAMPLSCDVPALLAEVRTLTAQRDEARMLVRMLLGDGAYYRYVEETAFATASAAMRDWEAGR